MLCIPCLDHKFALNTVFITYRSRPGENQELGLPNTYNNVDEFRLYCGQLNTLALLPPSQVQAGMNFLKENQPDAAEQLVEYFDQTYVLGQLRER